MAREQTFLDRIASSSRRGRRSPTAEEDVQSLMESVRDHLVRLLNARHGMSEALEEYGLPAMTDMMAGIGDHVQRVEAAIKTAVEKYEPRLRRVRVTCNRDPEKQDRQMLVFRIDGILVGRDEEHRVWYETAVTGNGDFDVTG